MTLRTALAAALLAAGTFTSLGGVASAACEPFPLISDYCQGHLPGADDIPEVDSDIQCTYNPETGRISCS